MTFNIIEVLHMVRIFIEVSPVGLIHFYLLTQNTEHAKLNNYDI